MKKRALGKGLDALLPPLSDEGTPNLVDIDLLFPNPRQPRQRFTAESLEELASSIRENGIVQPIVARKHEGRYEIVAGERRWRAAQLAQQLKVPVVVMNVPDARMLELALLENIQRENLNPIEEARAYRMLIEDQGFKQEDISRRLGKARSTITNAIRLLQFPAHIQAAIESGALSAGQARPLLGIDDPKLQAGLAEAVIRRGLSARDVEKLVGRMRAKKKSAIKAAAKDPNLLAAEERLSRHLATRVTITPEGRGGKIVLHYASEDELDRLFEALIRLG